MLPQALHSRSPYTRSRMAFGNATTDSHTDSHTDSRPRLAATIMPLLSGVEPLDVRESLAWASVAGFRAVQLSATDPATRPRELKGSARRDFCATLARNELQCSGIDFFIPPSHWSDPQHMERAHDALINAILFAAELGLAPVLAPMPEDVAVDVLASIAEHAARAGVSILRAAAKDLTNSTFAPPFAACIDCATVLGEGARPEDLVARSGASLGGIRLVDLHRSGLRGPLMEPRESRLDALALKVALEISGFRGIPVIDARQWALPREGLEKSLARWSALGR